jgi:hypothetical protein
MFWWGHFLYLIVVKERSSGVGAPKYGEINEWGEPTASYR